MTTNVFDLLKVNKMTATFFNCSKLEKWLLNFCDLFKVAKMTTKFLARSKSAKLLPRKQSSKKQSSMCCLKYYFE